jgi:uncharacterized membrane protein
MPLSPVLLTHITGAVVGLLSGYSTMIFRKGSGWHSAAGSVFAVSMLVMSGSGAYVATFERPNMLNVVVSLVVLYLVSTGWRAARRRNLAADLFDAAGTLSIGFVSVMAVVFGIQAMTPRGRDGMPPAAFFVFGAIAILLTQADVRMLLRRGLTPAQRLGRHLWRMGLALLIASFSLYPGQAKLFSRAVRDTNLLAVPHVLLLGSLLLWLVRVRGRKRAARRVASVSETPPATAFTHDAAA